MAFAGRWAEVVFAAYRSKDRGVEQYRALKQAVSDAGRDPDAVVVAPAIGVVTGETDDIVAEKLHLLDRLARPEDGLALLCETLNVDFSDRPVDEPFTDDELSRMSWHSLRDSVVQASGKANPSVRDFVEVSGRGTLREAPVFAGTPEKVADQLEDWFGDCCDGFVVAAGSIPGSYEDFSRLVVPVLRRRGLVPERYEGATLRENMGLPPIAEPA